MNIIPPGDKKTSVTKRQKSETFYIVGIGTSAGGLEALQNFFDHCPPNTGLAFVIVQHLSPKYRSLLPELLARHTTMPVNEAKSNLELEPDQIYIIPGGKNIVLQNGMFRVTDRLPGIKLNFSIDIFFNSLAKEQQNKAIGIILSGSGLDGTIGGKSIKDAGGTILVQDPKHSKFDGMPRSAIINGLADYVLLPEQLPEELMDLISVSKFSGAISTTQLGGQKEYLFRILKILAYQTGYDFFNYKKPTLLRRIAKRMNICNVKSVEQYADYLYENPDERLYLVKEFLIGVTKFFRDTLAFKVLEKSVLPDIVKSATTNKKVVKVWVGACSTGEEAYSIAILLEELKEITDWDWNYQVFASDIDAASIDQATKGIYNKAIETDIKPEKLAKYFIQLKDQYQIIPKIRKNIVFSKHDILQDPPFNKMDLITCRNLLIYLENDVQQKVLNSLHYATNHNGYIMLGASEHIGPLKQFFQEVDKKWKIYKNLEPARLVGIGQDNGSKLDHPISLPQGINKINFALKKQTFHVNNRPFTEEKVNTCASSEVNIEEVKKLKDALNETRQNLQETIEKMEISNEEMQTTNEELLAANEELQITNEELQTLNEELHTVNAALQEKNIELRELNSDIENLMKSTNIGTIFLDRSFKIRKFTPSIGENFHLRKEDIGRLIAHFADSFGNKNLIKEVQIVLDTLQPLRREFQNPDGTWFLEQILPYRTQDDMIKGVVINFINIDSLKKAMTEKEEVNRFLSKITDLAPSLIYVFDIAQKKIVFTNRILKELGYTREELRLMGDQLFLHITHPDYIDKMKAHYHRLLGIKMGEIVENETKFVHKDGKQILWCRTKETLYEQNPDGSPKSILGIAENITAKKKSEIELRKMNKELERFAYLASHDLKEPLRSISSFSQRFIQKYGDHVDVKGQKYLDYIIKASDRMQVLTNQLLIYSKLGHKNLKFEPTDMNHVLEETLTNLHDIINKNNANIEFKDLPIVWGNKMQLGLLLQNLISNGIKYRKKDSPKIEISCLEKEHAWQFCVSDNGIGIAGEHHGKVFEVFKRLHNKGEYEGTGIGLANCKRIVLNHNGHIWLESKINQGSYFYFTLPKSS